MIFNDIRPESLGCVKIVSVKDRFLADRKQQTIERMGGIIASISVPSVRVVEAEMLARAPKASDLMLTLDKLAAWLHDAGEAKLELEQTEGTYYKARCTGMDEPTFNGLSARFVVTFTCRDYRQYNLYNDEPVRGADPPSDNFTFAGKHCLNDMGCMFVLDKRPGTPSVVVSKYDVLGHVGTLRYDQADVVLEEQPMSGKLYFVNRIEDGEPLTDAEIEQRLHDVASWLVLAGRAPLIFDSDTTRAYLAELEDSATFARTDWENGRLELKLTIQPCSQDVEETSLTKTLSLSANAAQNIDLTDMFPRGVGYVTPLIVEITNTGSASVSTLTIGYKDRLGSSRQAVLGAASFALSAGQMVRVDGEDVSVTKAGQNAILSYTGDFPSVSPGALSISVKSSAATSVSVKVSAKARWL